MTAQRTKNQLAKPGRSPIPQSSTRTMRPTYVFLHLSLLTDPPVSGSLDAITVRTHLSSALGQFLGMTGAAIPIDILKVNGRDCWIRCPREDGKAVIESVSGWVGSGAAWKIVGRGAWLGCTAEQGIGLKNAWGK